MTRSRPTSRVATDRHDEGQQPPARCNGRPLLPLGSRDQRDAHHYDKASRTGPKIFVGEWATKEGQPTPTLNAAVLGDAAWMTGMERNSDLILISCYAPLFVNVNRGASQWSTTSSAMTH